MPKRFISRCVAADTLHSVIDDWPLIPMSLHYLQSNPHKTINFVSSQRDHHITDWGTDPTRLYQECQVSCRSESCSILAVVRGGNAPTSALISAEVDRFFTVVG